MTREQEIKERLSKVSPGQWHMITGNGPGQPPRVDIYCGDKAEISATAEFTRGRQRIVVHSHPLPHPSWIDTNPNCVNDCEFVSHSKSDVEFLLARNEWLERELSILRVDLLKNSKPAAPEPTNYQTAQTIISKASNAITPEELERRYAIKKENK